MDFEFENSLRGINCLSMASRIALKRLILARKQSFIGVESTIKFPYDALDQRAFPILPTPKKFKMESKKHLCDRGSRIGIWAIELGF
jgi:hypothetical protein